jgi:hypothetical protein
MANAQVIGREEAVKTFEAYQADVWGLYEGNKLVVAGVADDLDDWLTRFEKAGNAATYCIRIYYDITDPKQVSKAEEYNGAFTFKYFDVTPYGNGAVSGFNQKLMERIEGLEKKISGGDQEENAFESLIMGYLEDPVKLGQAVGIVRQAIGLTPINQNLPAAAIGSTGGGGGEMDTEDKLTRLSAALDKIEKTDKQLLEHLEKLAKVAETNPGLYNILISNLDKL